MKELSVLIGGQAGDGINQAEETLARILAGAGYRVYGLVDYPSLIRGGHNFAIVRGAEAPIGAHRDAVDFVLALNQETADRHRGRLADPARLIHDPGTVKGGGSGIPIQAILKEAGAPAIMRNSCLIGGFAGMAGVAWDVVEKAYAVGKDPALNLTLARRGYDAVPAGPPAPAGAAPLPLVTGNEAIGLGLLAAGLDAYVSYPMTPTSNLLHFLAAEAGRFDLKVVHPESEIAAILMALGFACAGERAAVGTSGGGFCLMTEGMSLAGMAEIPVVIVLGQRPGPSTGLPTCTSQADLDFALSAGHGEFPRLVVAPGTPGEAYAWSSAALDLSWKYQVPAIVLVDKTLCEGIFSFDIDAAGGAGEEEEPCGGGAGYARYRDTASGVSPLCFPPDPEAVVKVNSYEHDAAGITTELPEVTKKMQEKRLRKGVSLAVDLERFPAVTVGGDAAGKTAILTWGSNAGVCGEVARGMGVRSVSVALLSPFPTEQLRRALEGVERIVSVEHNAAGQFAARAAAHGFAPAARILRYDGRPFSVEEMERELKGVIG